MEEALNCEGVLIATIAIGILHLSNTVQTPGVAIPRTDYFHGIITKSGLTPVFLTLL